MKDEKKIESADRFFTGSALIFVAANKDQYLWSHQLHHDSIFWNISDLCAKGIIAVGFFLSLYGFSLLLVRGVKFASTPKRLHRIKKRFSNSLKGQTMDTPLNTFLYMSMGFMSFGMPIYYLESFIFLGIGYGAFVSRRFGLHVANPPQKLDGGIA